MTAHWDSPIASRCTELSPYGMWLETSAPLARDELVVMSFVPPRRERELVLFGRVLRTDGIGGVAIEFESLDWFEQKTLADCLRGIPPRFPGQRLSGVHPVA